MAIMRERGDLVPNLFLELQLIEARRSIEIDRDAPDLCWHGNRLAQRLPTVRRKERRAVNLVRFAGIAHPGELRTKTAVFWRQQNQAI